MLALEMLYISCFHHTNSKNDTAKRKSFTEAWIFSNLPHGMIIMKKGST